MTHTRTIFSQLIDHLPYMTFYRCVERYNGDNRVRTFSCWDQFLCLAFSQLTYREGLRDIESCLKARKDKLYHMGIKGNITRSNLADANERRDWRIYEDFARKLIATAQELYADDGFGVELKQTAYALDSTTIDLCLSLFPWALFRQAKGAVKLHTLLNLQGSIPTVVQITDGKVHDVKILDTIIPEPGAIYVMDRGYLDFTRLHKIHRSGAFFVIRAKNNIQFRRLYSRAVDKSTGLRCDQTIALTASRDGYPDLLRRIGFHDDEKKRNFNFLTNNFVLPALTIVKLYKSRWKVELFFKWIKQHLRIKRFYGVSENAVKIQIWVAISVYVLVAIVKKRLALKQSLYTILQLLSVTLFEKVSILEAFTIIYQKDNEYTSCKQLNLFDF